jgi:protein-disulfide isomerase-like protein with CxxC motif
MNRTRGNKAVYVNDPLCNRFCVGFSCTVFRTLDVLELGMR